MFGDITKRHHQCKLLNISMHRGHGLCSKSDRVHVNDIKYLVRKDPKKYARVTDLLAMNKELKRAHRRSLMIPWRMREPAKEAIATSAEEKMEFA